MTSMSPRWSKSAGSTPASLQNLTNRWSGSNVSGQTRYGTGYDARAAIAKPKIKLDRANPCHGLFWTRPYFEPKRHKFAVLFVPLSPPRRLLKRAAPAQKKSQSRAVLRLGVQ